MANILIEQDTMNNIANAIRAKNGLSTTYTPTQMVNAINNLSTSGSGGTPWVRPSDWPDLSKMDVSGGDILYMTSYADEVRGFCSFLVTCTGSYTVEVGTISGSTFTTESTQTFPNNSYCKLYYGSANGTYKVLRVTGTNISGFTATGSSPITIDTFHSYERSQGIIDIVGKLPSCTLFKCATYNIINIEVSNLKLSGNINGAFTSCYSLANIDTSTWDVSAVTSVRQMFYYCVSLTSLDLSNWDMSAVTDMYQMFYCCYSLVNLDVSTWNTSSVTNMSGVFFQCRSLASLNVSNWNTSSVVTMESMFSSCNVLTSLDVSNWNISAVTNISSVFSSCYSLTNLDVSRWDTSSVTNMASAFNSCSSLKNLDVSDWDTSSVVNMGSMFIYCNALASLDVSNWNTSSVTTIGNMFQNCYSLTSLDVSNWDFSNIITTASNSIFGSCYSLHGSLTFPSSLTYVGTSCFSNCRGLYEWHFLATTPPTLANTNAFGNMTDYGGKKIYVPAESLEAYKTATNWSTYASYMIGE